MSCYHSPPRYTQEVKLVIADVGHAIACEVGPLDPINRATEAVTQFEQDIAQPYCRQGACQRGEVCTATLHDVRVRYVGPLEEPYTTDGGVERKKCSLVYEVTADIACECS